MLIVYLCAWLILEVFRELRLISLKLEKINLDMLVEIGFIVDYSPPCSVTIPLPVLRSTTYECLYFRTHTIVYVLYTL